MKTRPVLTAVLAFGVVIVLVIVFFVSVGLGAINYVTSCGINPISLLAPPAPEPAVSSSPTTTATNKPVPSATTTAVPASASPSATPSIPVGGLFAAFQASAGFSAANQTEQRKNAATIVSIGEARPEKFTKRDIEVAIATAIQESNLLSLPKGDLDSLGLFQQRPSVGTYGSASDIMNITHSINAFYDRLAGVANRDQMAMIDIAIKIQKPSKKAYHSRWNWDALATAIVDIYSGSSVSGNVNTCAQSAGVYGSGEAHLPLDPGYHVSDGFADPRPELSIGSKPHIGIDLVYGSNTRGKPVYAAFSGVVVQSGFGGGCNQSNNNPVMILSTDGLEIGYLHMNGADIIVKKGDHVSAGQQIGAIGSCGQSTGPHLHFEVTPASDHDAWLSTIRSVQKYGTTWLDPEGVMAHYGVKLLP